MEDTNLLKSKEENLKWPIKTKHIPHQPPYNPPQQYSAQILSSNRPTTMRLSIARSLQSKLGVPTATTRAAVASYSTLPSRHEIASTASAKKQQLSNKNNNIHGKLLSASSSPRTYTTYSQLPSEHQMVYEMCRKFADEELAPNAGEWDQKHEFPTDAIDKLVSRPLPTQ